MNVMEITLQYSKRKVSRKHQTSICSSMSHLDACTQVCTCEYVCVWTCVQTCLHTWGWKGSWTDDYHIYVLVLVLAIAMIQHQDQGNLPRQMLNLEAYGFGGLDSAMILLCSRQMWHDSGAVAESLNPNLEVGGGYIVSRRKRMLTGNSMGSWNLKPTPGTYFLPQGHTF